MTYDSNGRFGITETAEMMPGEDFLTRSIVGPFIDTRRHIEFEQARNRPRIYLSIDTIREMAEDLGLFDEYREQVKAAHDDAMNEGYALGIKENFDGDLAGIADRLDYMAVTLRGGLRDLPTPVAPPSEDISGGADSESPEPRQPRKASSKPRPDDIPAATGSIAPLSL